MEEYLINLNKTLNQIVNMLNVQDKAVLDLEETIQYTSIGRSRLIEIINTENSDFPYFRNGKKILVNKSQLDLWLERTAKEHRTI